MKNDTSLFFLTLSLICIWLIVDNFLGHKYIDNLIFNIIGGGNTQKTFSERKDDLINGIDKIGDTSEKENAEMVDRIHGLIN